MPPNGIYRGPIIVREGVRLTLSENISLGGRISLSQGAELTLEQGAKISGNSDGGVNIGDNCRFTMYGGEISGNTTSDNGGGVGIDAYSDLSIFTKAPLGTTGKSGIIYGYVAGNSKSNKTISWQNGAVKNGCGHAVYVYGKPIDIRRETTAEEGVQLDSRSSGTSNGWEE